MSQEFVFLHIAQTLHLSVVVKVFLSSKDSLRVVRSPSAKYVYPHQQNAKSFHAAVITIVPISPLKLCQHNRFRYFKAIE